MNGDCLTFEQESASTNYTCGLTKHTQKKIPNIITVTIIAVGICVLLFLFNDFYMQLRLQQRMNEEKKK